MIVCIAEKPSVGRDIARIIGATNDHKNYMEGNGYQVTWTFGHLCTLKEPNDYTDQWKRWSLGSLPMIPSRFGIKLIEDEGIKRQFAVIEKLMQQADGIINCGDAGQEGELIQRWVMQKAQAKCPVQRLWISSMTDEAGDQLIDFIAMQSSDYLAVGQAFVSGLRNRLIRHAADPELDASAASCARTWSGDAWRVTRRGSTGLTSPIESCMLAAWGAHHLPSDGTLQIF